MNDRKRSIVTGFQRYVLNPLMRPFAGRLPGPVLLETIGRRSGVPRVNPVGAHPDDHTLWIVAEHGRSANYVRNIEANPNVRVRMGGRWRTGRAVTMPEDDPRRRLRFTPNDLMARLVATDLLTIRIDLDPR